MSWRVSVIGLLVLAGCQGKDTVVVRSPSQYLDLVEEVRLLTEKRFERADAGETMSELDKKALERAATIFDGLVAFDPRAMGPIVGSGKTYLLLERPDLAAQRLALVAKALPEKPEPEIRLLAAEGYALLSQSLFDLKRYADAVVAARKARMMSPSNANYAVAEASALLQTGDETKAHEVIHQALSLDPNNRRALQLDRFITH